ncbi:MAG: D-aminoacylase [candidate division KSB1 bacterium]|nr:D-aminoacylase [candidate division KSB1 bacterium]MDZ7274372.1 D-aminoacylase [candidate division KSB1 bacterium]MDZ7284966.1 D-aminoacylase [candidate division KSB1 bacterium]MDZ7297613.1 D-aminoacylase [candidate division KSB1 bacterium]MDZ7306353.1 D-aminoacylase [candidate division KSB1 bacterium]
MAKQYSRREFLQTGLAGALATTPLLAAACAPWYEFDLLLIGGLLYDGSGRDGMRSDLGVQNGRITAIGDLRDRSAKHKLDVSGLAVAPGFIDFHSHSDEELLLGGEAQSKIRQGVTTEILGQDGDSLAPLNEKMRAELHAELSKRFGLTVDWQDFTGYFRRLQAGGLISNAASMVGQGTLRQLVVGLEDRPATPEEIAQMQTLLRTALQQGACGISSGLEYTPGSFASTEEIIALCRTATGRTIYSTHMRNEDDTLLEAVAEAIRIAQEAGVALNISHIKASGHQNWHKQPEMLAMLAAARQAGLRVTCDRYPYTAYATGLSSLFPLWARAGGNEAFLQRLQDAETRAQLRPLVQYEADKIGGWQSVMISSLPNHPRRREYEGMNLAELARSGADPFDLLVQFLLIEKGGGGMVGFAMPEEDTARLLADPYCMPASDGAALAEQGVLHSGHPHPRSYGTFPRVLGKYVREQGIMTLGEAVRKLTALPAQTLRLAERGMLKPGYWADVVAFDPQTVADRATWSQPHQYPAGIPFVVVNGQLVIDREKFTGALAGRVLRAPA